MQETSRGRREADSEHGKCQYNAMRKRAWRWRGGMAVGLGWNRVRLGGQMGCVCNRLRAKLGSFRNPSCERVQRAGGMSWCVGMVRGNRGETMVRGALRGSGSQTLLLL